MSSQDNPGHEVSTLDLVATQRHILGIESFTHTGQYLAADVNGSNCVSTLDLIQLQRFLLGDAEDFPIGQSWLFSAGEDDESVMGTSQWMQSLRQQSYIGYEPLVQDIPVYPVKIGDVNWSAFD